MTIEQIPPAGRSESTERLYPNAAVLIHFVNHTTRADADGIDALIEDADIYLPEIACALPNSVTDLKRMAKGDYKSYERVKQKMKNEPFFLAVTEMLYKRKPGLRRVNVELVDVPNNNYWNPRMLQLHQYYKNVELHPSLDDTLRVMDEHIQTIAETQKERDGIIVDNLVALVKRTPYSTDKNSSQKRPTTILMTIGGIHTGVLTGLQERGVNAQSTLSRETKGMRSLDVATKMHMAGERIDRRLLLRVVAESLLEKRVKSDISHKMDEALYALSGKMDDRGLEGLINDVTREPQGLLSIAEAQLIELTGHSNINDENIDLVLAA